MRRVTPPEDAPSIPAIAGWVQSGVFIVDPPPPPTAGGASPPIEEPPLITVVTSVPAKVFTPWDAVEEVLLRHAYKPDLQAVKVVYSSIAAHTLKGAPVWPVIVAPPGSMKTEIVNGMTGYPHVHLIDTLTMNTFLSGQIDDGDSRLSGRRVDPSLLKRIGSSGIIIYPDFSTIISMNKDAKGKILADMRRIYDGRLTKEVGTAESGAITWKGRTSFVACITPEIDINYSAFQTLGERFLMVRWPRWD